MDCRESDVCELSSAIKIKDLDTPNRQINIELGKPKFGIIINKVQAETVNNARSCNGKSNSILRSESKVDGHGSKYMVNSLLTLGTLS